MINIKKWSIVASLLLVIGVVGSVLTFKSMLQTADVFEKEVMTAEKISHIQVNVDQAEVDIVPVKNTEEITVELTGEAAKYRKYKFEAKAEGNSVMIQLKERQRKLFHVHFFNEGRLSLKITVPEKEYDAMTVKVLNGRIQASGLNVRTGTVQTVNGRIHLSDIQSNNIKARSENGEIHLNEVAGKLTGTVTNGHISMVTNNLERPVDLKTVNGRITIETDHEPDHVTFDVSVVNGRAEIFGRKFKDAMIGNGKHLVRLETINGNINVHK